MIIYFSENEEPDLYSLSMLLFCAEWWNKSMNFRLYSECVCFHLDANNMACLGVIFEKYNFIENFHLHRTINNTKCVKMMLLQIPNIKRFQKIKIGKLLTIVQWLAVVQWLASYPIRSLIENNNNHHLPNPLRIVVVIRTLISLST